MRRQAGLWACKYAAARGVHFAMCGICGIAGADDRASFNPKTLERMADVIRHRGPDESGYLLRPGVGLAMRRLSIIDLSTGSQPIANEDGTVHTVFNGEIFNFKELREDLARKGHRLRTAGDTETIVHLYEEHGTGFVKRLRGMFGIAIWDEQRGRLVLARDRMGVKPLYYAQTPAGLAFASEVKSLIAGGLVDPTLDPVSAELFLAHGYVPGTRTLFAGVHKLLPAHVLVWERGQIVEHGPYWSAFADTPEGVGASWEADQEELLHRLREATRARMVSDVPLGVMLSGGLDSSLITALMAEASSGPVKTFSIAFAEDAGSNELDDAREVATRLGTEHHELVTSASEQSSLLDDALWHLEEPVADTSCLGFLLLSRLARESVTVALSGQGADELLGGYRKHQIAAYASVLERRAAPLRPLLRGASNLAPDGSTVGRGLLAVGSTDPAQRLLAMSRIVQSHERERLLSPAFRVEQAERLIADSVLDQQDGDDLSALGRTLQLDSRLALVDNMLLYFDKMSMATSLEVRVPFMDHDVVSFCFALPDSRRVLRGRRKELLKRVAGGLVDDRIINKPKRGFFHSALGAWLTVHRDELVRDTLLDERAKQRGQFEPGALERLIRGAGTAGKKVDQQLFAVLLLELWQRAWVDRDGDARRLASQVPAVSRAA